MYHIMSQDTNKYKHDIPAYQEKKNQTFGQKEKIITFLTAALILSF